MRLIGYVRVSRVAGREGDSFISPDVQRERIEQLARANGHTIIAWQTDLDQSGSHINRPGFQAALAAVDAKEADGIAVAKLDRFARSVSGAGRALERLEQAGGTLVVGDLGMDTSTPAGKLMRNVLMALAEFELDRIRDNWLVARDRAVGRGVHISRVPPIGYRKLPDSRLDPDPDVAPLIRDLFLRRAAGESWRNLCAWLDTVLPRPGPWGIGALQGVVRNRVYLGEARAGDALNVGAHAPIVSRAEWEAAQNRHQRHPRSGHQSLLAGLIYCDNCDGLLTPSSDGRRGYRRYDCQSRVCAASVAISAPKVETYVERTFLELAAALPVVEATQPTDPARDPLERLQQAEAELAEYRDAQLVSVIGREAFVAGLRERARVVEAAQQDVVVAQRQQPFMALTASVVDEWPALTVLERRLLLAAALEGVWVRRAHLRGQGTPVDARVRLVWRPLD